MPIRSLSCELHARLLLDVQAALKLTTETVSLESIDSHFQRNVRGAPCNTSLTVLPLPGVYRNAYPSIVSVNGAVMISGGHPCRTSCPDSAGSNLPPTSCIKAMPRQSAMVPALMPKSCIVSMGGAVSRSISGIHLAEIAPAYEMPALALSSPPSSRRRS